MDAKLWKKARWLVFALTLSWGILFSLGAFAADPPTYTDRFGYFSFTPPAGWTQKDYPEDNRGRVRFTTPDSKATLSIIARPVQPEEATFEKLLASKQLLMEEMRKKKPEGKYHLKEGTICQFKCVEVDVEYPGTLIHESYLFVEKGFHINFGYGAVDKKNLAKYRQIALKSLCTIKLKK